MELSEAMTEMRTVTVRDRRAEDAAWGSSGPFTIITRTVTVPWVCPQCGGPRGEIHGMNMCEDGDYAWMNVWGNPCGHIDMYPDVIDEARSARKE